MYVFFLNKGEIIIWDIMVLYIKEYLYTFCSVMGNRLHFHVILSYDIVFTYLL